MSVGLLGGALVFAAAPAAVAATGQSNNRPHAVTTSTTGHGHGHGHAAGQPGHTTKSGHRSTAASTARPRTHVVLPASPSGGSAGYDGPRPAPASPAPVHATPRPAAAPAPAPTPAHSGSSWRRQDPDQHNRGVVRAFTTDLRKAGQSAGFPALLIAVIAVFLLVQHRLDQRDVKLSHADWATDQGLEFSAPATIRRQAAANPR